MLLGTRLGWRKSAAVGVAGLLCSTVLATTAPAVAQDTNLTIVTGWGDGTVAGQAFGPGDFTVVAGDSVTFKYRVYIHKGVPKEADVEQQYARYVGAAPPAGLKLTEME